MKDALIHLHLKQAAEAARGADYMMAKLQALEALRLINQHDMDAREFAEPRESVLAV